MTTKQSEQSHDHLQVEWLLFFPQWKCTIAGQKLRNLAIQVYKKLRKKWKERSTSLFVSVEINSTIAELTVWHNWLNRVRLAWSRKTYVDFATGHGATTRGIYIRSFFWKKQTTKNVRASTFLWGWAILYVGCQALFVFMLCNCANLLCINPGLVKSCYSGRSYAMCCVNLGKSSLFGNLGHNLGDRILSQGLVLVPTLCRLGELC